MLDVYNVLNNNATAFEEPAFGTLMWNPTGDRPGSIGQVRFPIRLLIRDA